MRKVSSVMPSLKYELNGLHQVVVQKGNVATKYIYALQQLAKGTDTVVYRARKDGFNAQFTKGEKHFRLFLKGAKKSGTAGSHTQTWEYAGPNGNGEWFIGTKPKKLSSSKYYWATQIARVKFQNKKYTKNTQMPRLSALNRAGAGYDDNVVYPGVNLLRSEAAVSPNYLDMLIVTIDTSGTAHFGFYSVNEINKALNGGPTNYPLDQFRCSYAFKIENFTSAVGSIQGFDIDDKKNIYISSEAAPKTDDVGQGVAQDRYIYKIPYGYQKLPNGLVDWNSTENWHRINLNANNNDHNNGSVLDRSKFVTEFESIQVINKNDAYLTVSYHDATTLKTLHSRIYEITWNDPE